MKGKISMNIDGKSRAKVLRFMSFIFSILIIVLIVNILPVNSESADEEKVIKVACSLEKGYFEILEDGSYYGYGFEYLTEMEKHIKCEFEYVFGTSSECMDMLESGKADIMPMIVKSEANIDRFEVSDYSYTTSKVCLISKENREYTYEDFEVFDGMKVGLLNLSVEEEALDRFCNNNNFKVNKIFFENIDELLYALNSDSVDAIITENINIIKLEEYSIIGNVGLQEYFLASLKGRNDIINDINYAMEQIQIDDPLFKYNLSQVYLGVEEGQAIKLTKEELDYIEKSPSIKVALYDERNILSDYDENINSFTGIAYEIMEMISKKSGLKFEYIKMPVGVRGVDFFAQGGCRIIAPVMSNELVMFSNQIDLIEPCLSTSLVMVGKNDYVFNKNAYFTIAISKSFFGAEANLKTKFPNALIIYAQEEENCFNMVLDGKADVTFDNRLEALYRMRSIYYSDLSIIDGYDIKETMHLMTSLNEDELLKSILGKSIRTISKDETTRLTIENIVSKGNEYTVAEFFYKYRYYIVVGIILVVMLIYLIIFTLVLRRKGQKYNEEKNFLEEQRKANEKYQKELYRQANFDSMTGLLNRNGFYEKTRKLLDENRDVKFIILRGDIDQFKVFNDIMGVKMGDELIKYVADMWKQYFIGKLGTYGYLGGDDYICCYPHGIFDPNSLISKMNEWFDEYRKIYSFSVSFGAYIVEDLDIDVSIMCDRAELALAKAKRSKDTRFCIYEEYMREQVIKEQEIINYIPTAFEEQQFEVYLQPQYDGVKKEIVGAEALARWNHPELGLVYPGLFIPVMEANGMITLLDIYIIEQVCIVLQQLYKEEKVSKDFSIAVNISRIDTFNNNIVNKTLELLEKYNIPITSIRLEITESAYIEQHEQVSSFVKNLKEKGFIIEMDDFGSGYSSLNALKDVPVDTLKLDLKFLAGENSQKGGIIINSVIRMAKWLNIPVIAEGVETVEQAEYLKSMGCKYMQGYYFARPMAVGKFIELLEENKQVSSIVREDVDNEISKLETLLDSKNINTILFEKMGGAIVMEYYNGNLEMIMVNDSFYEVLQVERNEYESYQLHMQDFLNDGERKIFMEKINILLEKGEVVFELPIERKNKVIWAEFNMTILSNIYFRYTIVMTIEDVTENKEMKKKIKEFESLINNRIK